ncbi:MAG: NADH-quinone oxidoreductase subunit L [Acidobacteriota bacterium]
MNTTLLWYIPLLPFAGVLINGTIGRKLPRSLVSTIALLFTLAPAAIVLKLWSFMKFGNGPDVLSVASGAWIKVTGFHVNFAFTVDHLTLIMLAIVTGVGFLIHVYSVGYMAHEEGYWRFFAYLNLFMFFMLVLVLSSSFLLLFVGWEGVGLASYLLIGFYFTKDSAATAGKKAFVVNRIGDFGFLLAMFLLIAHYGSLSFDSVFTQIAASPIHGGFLTAIALLLFVGATGKSAQIPLYIWLPDAMEGPTPVSALIHAATMVTAGVYMLARCHVLIDRSPAAMVVIACIGAATALVAATIGLVQHDIKRVLAYSTVSQLGYMVLACGVGAYSAGIFHLMTHAFFKALLFLSAGSVIHALSGEQDMRLMGGLWKRIPVTFACMTAGVFAIAGMPLLSGFFSKDEILYQAYISPSPVGRLVWVVGVLTALLTSFYMFRLWFKTFFGQPRFDEASLGHGHEAHGVHESPLVMTLPLMILAVLSVIGGFVGVPTAFGGHNEFEHFLDPVLGGPAREAASGGTAVSLSAVATMAFVLGLFVAYYFYFRKPGRAAELAQRFKPVYRLLDHKYWVDEIYGALIVAPLLGFSRLILGGLVEGAAVQGTGAALGGSARGLGWLARRIQSGNIRSYAGWLALGAAVFLVITLCGHHGFMR